ncbi:MAG: DUF11 domain-containing protein [Gammaproteobacteria bacterium]|nr:DUF11 domain-containing protein [Gammaproteobacteria bacterium]
MINTPVRGYLSLLRRLLQLLPPAGLLLFTLFAAEAQAAVTVTRTSSPIFYSNSDADTATTSPKCNYLSFDVTTDAAINDAWVEIDVSTTTYLFMGGGDDGIFHFGPMAANETRAVFYYVCSTYTTKAASAAQSFSLSTYEGKPVAAGGGATVPIGTTTDSVTIDDDVIEANPNTVNAIWADINPSVLGATTTLTVDGDTGTIGCSVPSSCDTTGTGAGPMAFNPATFTDWRADAYELVATSIVLSVGNNITFDNQLYIDSVPSSSTTHYNAIYYFRPVATTASTTTLSPVSYITSGQPIKHTNLGSGAYATAGGLLPILPAKNEVLLAKSVSHATLPAQGGVVTYTLSATNQGGSPLSLDSFIDVLPAGATYVPGSSTFNNVSLPDPYISGSTHDWSSLFNIPAGATRSLIFQATLPATPGTYINSAIALIGNAIIDTTLTTSDNVPATASTEVLFAPTILKEFSPTALAVGISSTLKLTIGNPNVGHTLNGVAISDTLPASPAGLVFATPPDAATTCTGAALNISGTTISITGGTLLPEQSCTVSVKVTSSVNDVYTNTTGVVSSSNGGTGLTASAIISFTPKPTISKAFSVSSIPVGDIATLSFSITNNTGIAITGMTFDDLFPAGLVTANPASLSSSCGGTVNAWDGTTASALNAAGGDVGIQLSGGGIVDPAGSCMISIDVTAAAAGDYANTTSGVDSNESSPAGPVSNTATLSVLAPPTVSKAFLPAIIGKGQTSTLTITLSNSNNATITGAAFTDTYPTDLVNAAIPNITNSCGGTVTAVAGGGSLSLSAGTIPVSGCTVSVDVTSDVVNLTGYINTIGIGDVTTGNAGNSTVVATDTLFVNATPTIDKSFSFNPATGISTMTITITNNDVVDITGLSFTDLFPTGMSTDNPPSVSPAEPCGAGSSIESWNGTTAGTLSATGGDLGIKLADGQVAVGGSCTFSINLAVNALGVYQNQTSGLTGSFTGTGSASNIATWIAPAVGKTFTPTQVTPTTLGPSDISRLIITITNPSLTASLTGLRITDLFPTTATRLAGGSLTASITTSPTPNGTTTCTGGSLEAWDGTTATAINAAGGDVGIILSGGTLAPGASCKIEIDVYATDTTPAIYINTTGNVASNEGIGVSGADTLIITTKPTIKKSFLTSPIQLSGGIASTVMRIIVENNSGVDITAVEFSDVFPTSPSQMVVTDPATILNGCGGVLTDNAGAALVAGASTSIKLTGGAISSGLVTPFDPTCTIDIPVSVTAAGSYYNTTSGAVSSTNSEVGPVSNTAELIAHLSPPTVTKAFANTGFQVGNANRLTIILTNPNTTAITSMVFTDTYPPNLVNAAAPNIYNECGGTVTAAAGAGTLSISGGTIPATITGPPLVVGTCKIEVDLTATAAGGYTNTLAAGAVTSGNASAGPAADVTAATTAYLPPTLIKSFAAATLNSGTSTTLSLTLTNPASNPDAITDVLVDDTFPTGMTLQDAIFSYTPAACGAVTRTDGSPSVAGDGAIRFKVLSLAAGISCEAVVNITSSTAGAVTNTAGTPVATAATSLAALTGTTAWASITVQSAPSIMLLKSVQTISDPVNIASNPKAIPGAVMQYNIIATNSGAGSADLDSTMVFDPVPANTLLYVDDIGGAGSGPVLFTQGTTSSTLSYSFTSLADSFDDPALGDDLSFSNDGGTSYGATPTFDAVTGCDTTAPPITHIRVNPKGTFIGNTVPPSPSFQISFRVCLQ